jgi:hypothetical protein
MTEFVDRDRRTFLRRGAMGLGGLWICSLDELLARRRLGPIQGGNPYGPIAPVADETTGLSLLQLPPGFRYRTYAWTGDPLQDGSPCPGAHDGMAVVGRRGASEIVIVRNHEQNVGAPFTTDAHRIFAQDRAGGTTNLVFDAERGEWKEAWASLSGTARNCAGGVTPWGSWITCEETGTDHAHGFCFEVGAEHGDPRPLMDMGRFSHEAIMIDPATGDVYETEDAGSAGFYRFVPHASGDLRQGGELFILAVKQTPNLDLTLAYPLGTTWDVEWVRVADARALEQSTFAQGQLGGAAKFARLEGAWWGDRVGYIVSTSGGQQRCGQVFEYNPAAETLKLIYDSPAAAECDYPDNLTVTPRGGLLLCEDSGNRASPAERLIGLNLDGTTFTFAMNNVVLTGAYNDRVAARDYRTGEFCGACYSPDGRWLFVNTQSPGITYAITGPWGSGPL